MNCTRIGMDIAKSIFVLHGVDEKEQIVLKHKLRRSQMHTYFAQLATCEIAMEACASSHYWARVLIGYGHTVKLIAPQHVKPYVQGGKNDANDAKAICEAASRPSMKYVAVKSEAQQAIQSLIRIRHGLLKDRTACLNQIRGLMGEYGIVCPAQGQASTRKTLMSAIHDNPNLPELFKQGLQILAERLTQLDTQVKPIEAILNERTQTDTTVKRLIQIEGIGPITANAIASSVTDANMYDNARTFAASLGLTPRQNSSGGKERLGGITKRGDGYLRYLLIHGARTMIKYCERKNDERSLWLQSLLLR